MTGLLCGAVNGFFVAVMGLPALLVTLGTLALFRGLCYVLLGGTPISPLPDFFTALGNDNIPGLVVPWAIVPFLVLAVVFGIVLHRSTVGRRIYAIGGNPETAHYSGIRVARIRFVLFVVSGVVSGLAGMIYMGITSQVAPDGAQGLELDVITVVFLAGVSVLGGKGRITGVVLASILILALRKSLQLMNVSGYTQGIAVGGVLIAVAAGHQPLATLLRRRPGAPPPRLAQLRGADHHVTPRQSRSPVSRSPRPVADRAHPLKGLPMNRSALTLAVGATAMLTLSLTSCASDRGGSGERRDAPPASASRARSRSGSFPSWAPTPTW